MPRGRAAGTENGPKKISLGAKRGRSKYFHLRPRAFRLGFYPPDRVPSRRRTGPGFFSDGAVLKESGMTQPKTRSLRDESIGRLLTSYSLPAIVAMAVTSLYNVIDSVFIGHGVGPLALSALAVCFPLMNLMAAVCLLVGVGGATVGSITLGQGRRNEAEQVLGQVLTLELLLGVIFAALFQVLLDPLLVLFGASADLLPLARRYMRIIVLGMPITYVMLGLNYLMRASGYPTRSMLTAILSVAVNIALAPLFIFGFHWSMEGAGLATVLAQATGLVWLLLHFFDKRHVLHFQAGIYRLRAALTGRILLIGLPPFAMNLCASVVVVVINHSLYHYGGNLAIGAYGIVNRMLMLGLMIVMGLTQGMQPIIGFNYGARRPDRVRRVLRYGLVIATCITGTGFFSAQWRPDLLARLFTDDTVLINLTVPGLRICTAAWLLVGSQIVIANYFQAIGKAGTAMFLSLTRQLLYLLPALLILPRLFGLNGVWISMPVADTLSFLTAWIILLVKIRRQPLKNHVSGSTPPPSAAPPDKQDGA